MPVREQVDIVISAQNGAAAQVLRQVANEMNKLGQEGKKADDKLSGMFRGALGDVGKFALGMAGAQSITQALSTAVAQLTREYDNFLQRNRKAAESQLPFADVERQYSQVLSDIPLPQATQRVKAIAARTGVKAEVVGLGLEAALGGKGSDLPDEAGFAAVEAAAKYRPGPRTGADDISAIAQAILTLQKGFPGTSAEQAMAGIANAMRASRDTDIQSFATYTLPAIVKSRAFGGGRDSFQDLAAMEMAVGQRAEDPTGRRTATNFNNFLKQMKIVTAPGVGTDATIAEQYKFLMETDKGAQIRKKLLGPLFGGGAPSKEAIEGGGSVIDSLAEKLVGAEGKVGLKSESATFIPLVELLQDGDNKTKQLLRSTRQSVPDLLSTENVSSFRAREAELNRQQSQSAALVDRGMAGPIEAHRLGDTVGGVTGSIRTQIEESLQAIGEKELAQRLSRGLFDLASSQAETPEDVYEAAGTTLRNAKFKPRLYSMGEMGPVIEAPISPGEARANQTLDTLIRKMDEMIRATRETRTIRIESGGDHVQATNAAPRAGQRGGR